jgi:hypothetical protein
MRAIDGPRRILARGSGVPRRIAAPGLGRCRSGMARRRGRPRFALVLPHGRCSRSADRLGGVRVHFSTHGARSARHRPPSPASGVARSAVRDAPVGQVLQWCPRGCVELRSGTARPGRVAPGRERGGTGGLRSERRSSRPGRAGRRVGPPRQSNGRAGLHARQQRTPRARCGPGSTRGSERASGADALPPRRPPEPADPASAAGEDDHHARRCDAQGTPDLAVPRPRRRAAERPGG